MGEPQSPTLIPEIFNLSEKNSEIIAVPEGYANCIKASIADSVLLVFSGKILEDALQDSWRYDQTLWVDWAKEKTPH